MTGIPQTQYQNIKVDVPRYRYSRVPLNNISGTTVSLSPTSSNLLEFKVPAVTVGNMALSHLQYQYSVPAGGAGLWGIVFTDGLDFRTVYFGDTSLGIVDLQYCDSYANVARPTCLPQSQLASQDRLEGFFCSQQLSSDNLFPFSMDGLAAGVINSGGGRDYTEWQHLEFSSATNTALAISRQLCLGNTFVGTYLAENMDMVFGKEMYLRLQTNYLQRMAFYSTTPDNANANITQITSTAVTLTNVVFWYATEQNESIKAKLLAGLNSGKMKISIPFVYAQRFTSGAGTTNISNSFTLVRGFGRGFKRIIFVPYDASENLQYAYDHSNWNGTKVSTITSSIDGRPLVDAPLNCYNPYSSINPTGVNWSSPATFADDWREMKKVLKGSCIQTYAQYMSSWSYADSFGELPLLESKEVASRPSLIDDYFDINSADHVYSLTATSPATATHAASVGMIQYYFIVYRRSLVNQASGIVLEP